MAKKHAHGGFLSFSKILALIVILIGCFLFVLPLAMKFLFHQSAHDMASQLDQTYVSSAETTLQPVQIESLEVASPYDYTAEELEQAQRDPGVMADFSAIGDDLTSLDEEPSSEPQIVVLGNSSSENATKRTTYLMEIPALDLKIAVIRAKSFSDMYRCMRLGAAIFPKAPELNTIGNICISAHRTGSKDYFRHLDNLQTDDIIYLRSTDSVYQYQIVKIAIIDSDDWSVTGQTLCPTLTLLSCQEYQGISNGQRIMVQATLVSHS